MPWGHIALFEILQNVYDFPKNFWSKQKAVSGIVKGCKLEDWEQWVGLTVRVFFPKNMYTPSQSQHPFQTSM